MPKSCCPRSCRRRLIKEGLFQIYTRGIRRKKILDYKPELSEFNDLICGLTLYDHQARWGAEEVERWLTGESIPVDYGHDILPVKLGPKQEIQSDLDLIHILDEEESWYQLLFADRSSIDILCRWVGDYYERQVAKDFHSTLRCKSKGTRDILRKAARQFINLRRNQKS